MQVDGVDRFEKLVRRAYRATGGRGRAWRRCISLVRAILANPPRSCSVVEAIAPGLSARDEAWLRRRLADLGQR
jgi:hypothetical protein